MQTEYFRAMNSDIVLVAEGELSQVESGLVAAQNFVDASEKRFTRFSEQSELSALNRSAGSWFQASPDLFQVVREAIFYFHKTNGLFDPSILPSLKNAGYVHSMDEIRRVGSAPQPDRHQSASVSTFDSVELNETTSSIRLPADLQIDLGGIAKGWIAERAAHLLSQYASACAVNAGGDMFLIGYPHGQDSWEVGLEDPRNPARRYFSSFIAGRRSCHIICCEARLETGKHLPPPPDQSADWRTCKYSVAECHSPCAACRHSGNLCQSLSHRR